MLTILHLVSLKGMGGRAATALRQARLLIGRGHRVLMGCLPETAVESRSREMGALVFSDFSFKRGFRPAEFFRDCRRVSELCDRYQVDIVHAHLSQESWVACFGARLSLRQPPVIRSRGVVVPIKPHFFNRMMHNVWTERVIAPSRVIFDHLRTLKGFDQDKAVLLPDGVDTKRFSPRDDGAAVRAEFGVEPGAPFVVMVARLERVKGHTVFFQALANIAAAQRVPGLKALCACDERTPGAFDATVKAARDLGIVEETLKFTGMRNDVEKLIAAADAVVLPSLGSEGSSRVALEAGACGVPVIASDAGCLPEVILHGKTGWITPKGDATALADAICGAFHDPAETRKIGAAARLRVAELYDEVKMVERLEALYLQAAVKARGDSNVQASPR